MTTTIITTANTTMTKATETSAAVLTDVRENGAAGTPVGTPVGRANSARRSTRACKPRNVNTTRLYDKAATTRPGCSRCKESELSMKALSTRVNHVEELVMELSKSAQALVSSLGIDPSYLTAHMSDRERIYMSQFRLNSVNENQRNSLFDPIDELNWSPEQIRDLLRSSDGNIPANSPPHTPVSQPDVKPTVYLGDEGKFTAEPESDETMTATQRPPPTRRAGGGGASRSQQQQQHHHQSAILAQETSNCGVRARGNINKRERERADSGYASDPERRSRSKRRTHNNERAN